MVKISDLFEVKRGSCGNLDGYVEGATPLITATTYNNATGGFVTAKLGDRFFQPNSIAVAIDGDGSVMFASIQQVLFVASTHVEVLTPKDSEFWMSQKRGKLVAIASMLRTQRWRFNFGRSAAGRLKDLELDENVIEGIAAQVKIAPQKLVALEPQVLRQVVAKLRELYGTAPTIGEVFELKQGTSTSVANLAEVGDIPVVSATEKEVNAVAGYLAKQEGTLMPAGSISVAKDGKPGVARVQPVAFRATEHALVLIPKNDWLPSEKLILAALIERQYWRFSFARAAAEGRLSIVNLLDGFGHATV